MRAILFPGQGSQYVGMASDFHKKYDIVKKNFDMVDETLGFSLSEIILNGPEEKLKLTENTQPAIMTVGVSIFDVIKKNLDLNINPSITSIHTFYIAMITVYWIYIQSRPKTV